MTLDDLRIQSNPAELGNKMFSIVKEGYPICRSITGAGFRRTLDILKREIPLTVHEVPSGTPVFDWVVPDEWNVRDASVRDLKGKRVIDFQKNNLHLLNYSIPFRSRVSREELLSHLFTLPEQPQLIPYRTSYYQKRWGFCIAHETLAGLNDAEYEVSIETTLAPGHLTYGEYLLPGESAEEVLISTHACHPSLANDNLSGVALSTILAKLLTGVERRYSYRFLFIPGTIGAITWLALNEEKARQIKHGLVVACVGDPGKMTYKKSRRGDAEIDAAVLHVLRSSGKEFGVKEFTPYGYDERQYSSPGFNLAVGSLSRTPHGEFPEYHTSADGLDFVKAEYLAESLMTYLSVLEVLEGNRTYRSKNPKCEPQLGRRGLYSQTGGGKSSPMNEFAMLWVLNMSDGEHSLLNIAERSGMDFDSIRLTARKLLEYDLLE